MRGILIELYWDTWFKLCIVDNVCGEGWGRNQVNGEGKKSRNNAVAGSSHFALPILQSYTQSEI